MNLLESMGLQLRAVARLHYRAQRQQVGSCGITVMACHVLTELGQFGPMPMSELGRRLGLHKGWVSRAVAGLAMEDLLSCSKDEADGRVVVVGLTSEGKRKLKALNQALNQQAARTLKRIPGPNRQQVLQALLLIRTALQEDLPPREGSSCS